MNQAIGVTVLDAFPEFYRADDLDIAHAQKLIRNPEQIILSGECMPVRLFKFIAWVILVVSCTACATARLANPEEDMAAKQFLVPAGESNIYIYRNEDIVFNNEIPVDIDGKHAGNTNTGTFILKSVAPGKHSITALAENTETIEITTVADKNYFIWLEVRIGVVTNHAHFHLVDEAQGKSGVRECKLIE